MDEFNNEIDDLITSEFGVTDTEEPTDDQEQLYEIEDSPQEQQQEEERENVDEWLQEPKIETVVKVEMVKQISIKEEKKVSMGTKEDLSMMRRSRSSRVVNNRVSKGLDGRISTVLVRDSFERDSNKRDSSSSDKSSELERGSGSGGRDSGRERSSRAVAEIPRHRSSERTPIKTTATSPGANLSSQPIKRKSEDSDKKNHVHKPAGEGRESPKVSKADVEKNIVVMKSPIVVQATPMATAADKKHKLVYYDHPDCKFSLADLNAQNTNAKFKEVKCILVGNDGVGEQKKFI